MSETTNGHAHASSRFDRDADLPTIGRAEPKRLDVLPPWDLEPPMRLLPRDGHDD